MNDLSLESESQIHSDESISTPETSNNYSKDSNENHKSKSVRNTNIGNFSKETQESEKASERDSESENFEDFIDRNIDHESCKEGYWEKEQISEPQNTENQENCKTLVCWYCNKHFERGPVYEEHYSECYNRYCYMHM